MDHNKESGKILKCSTCNCSFKHRASYYRHIKNCGSESTTGCPKCGKKFARYDALKRHLKKCSGKRIKLCSLCKKEFQTPWHLKRHQMYCGKQCQRCKRKLTPNKEHECNLMQVKLPAEKKIVKPLRRAHDLDSDINCMLQEWEIFPKSYHALIDLAMCLQSEDYLNHHNQIILIWLYRDQFNTRLLLQYLFRSCHDIVLLQVSFNGNTDSSDAGPSFVDTSACAQVFDAVSAGTIRKRRQRLSQDVANRVRAGCSNNSLDMKEVLKLVIRQLDLTSYFKHIGEVVVRLPFVTRQNVWNFWHLESSESTNTTYLAKLRVSDRVPYQKDLDHVSTVTIVVKRKREFFQSIWRVVSIPLILLYTKYQEQNPQFPVSKGTFFNLKPFYVRVASSKDIEMCLCKLHLHAKWAAEAIINWAKKANVTIGPRNYREFFTFLSADCDPAEDTYISWECTPSKDEYCNHIHEKWNGLKQVLSSKDDGTTTVPFTEFQMKVCYNAKGEVLKNKKGEEVKRLVPVKQNVSVNYLMQFFDNGLLSKIINHRNMLRLYRNTNALFVELLNCVYLDIDFSETLTIGIKWEPQSLHWSKKQVIIHSGLVKCNGAKTYHPYVSDSRIHDQPLVNIAVNEMLSSTDITDEDSIIIESDNCTSQYKSAKHFFDIQNVANTYKKTVVRLYGVAGHGKGEVDHVGGIAKVAVRQQIAGGEIFSDATQITSFLSNKFQQKISPKYHSHEITEADLQQAREASRNKSYTTVEGSSLFQVLEFKPHQDYFKPSPRLCICDSCKLDNGSCNLFKEYQIQAQDICIQSTSLRSYQEALPPPYSIGEDEVDEFVVPSTYVAVAPGTDSVDEVWFLKVVEINLVDTKHTVDDNSHSIPLGSIYMSGHFLERQFTTRKATNYKLSKKLSFFYKESILCPYINITEGKKDISLSNEDYADVLHHIEASGYGNQ